MNRRSTFRSAPAPTRSAASSRAATSNISASRIGGAPICRWRAARTISTSCAIEYYRDRDVGFEGFTAGSYLFREEFTSRTWATRYDFPALKDGRVKRDVLPDDTPSGAQGWFINTRRPKFADRAAARGAQRRLRFRMDQQDDHVRRLSAHGLGVSELRHDGARQAERRGTGAARAVPRPPAGRSFRRALYAAGLRRLRPGSRAVAQGRAAFAGCRLRHPERQARVAERRAAHHRIPDRRAVVRAASHAVHQESRHPRHRRHVAHRRSGAIPGAARRLRLRHHHRPLQFLVHAGRFAALVLFLAGGGAARARTISPAWPIRRSMR